MHLIVHGVPLACVSRVPFKSKAQRRKFAQLLLDGKITDEQYEEWNRTTGRKVLPERLHPDKSGKRGKKDAKGTKKTTRAKATTRAKKSTRAKATTRARKTTRAKRRR